MWQYRAYATRAVDGDTIEVEVDLGFRLTMVQTVRVNGINAPELATAEGKAAKAAAWKWLTDATGIRKAHSQWPIVISTAKPNALTGGDKYGRWLASITRADGHDLATDMIAAGHALPWDGHGPKPVAS